MRILIPILVIVIAAVLGFPIWLAFIVGMIPYYGFIESTLPAQIIIQRFINPCESSAFLAIPLFVTSGVIMNYAGISRRLMDLADGLVGHLAGGLAHCNVLLSVLMGGVSGSAAADAAMESKILVPEMVRRGYDKNFSGAVTIASSLLTPIIPPGMGLIIYAMMTSTSVGKMLAAGYAPGLLGMVLMMIYVGYISKKRGYKGNREKPAAPKELGMLFVRAIWGLLLPFGLILILRIGMATATEVGALCVVYSLIVGVFFYREIKVEHIWPIIKESVMSTATVMVLLCASVPLTFFMTYETIPQKLAAFIINSNMSKVGFLLLINVIEEDSPSLIVCMYSVVFYDSMQQPKGKDNPKSFTTALFESLNSAAKKQTRFGVCSLRRVRDSNPRYISVHSISSAAPSTTRTTLHEPKLYHRGSVFASRGGCQKKTDLVK